MNSRRDRPNPPTPDDREKGAIYTFQIGPDSGASGVILDETGAVRFHFAPQPKRSAYSLLNLLHKPDFVVTEIQGKEVLRVRQCSGLPASFEIAQNEETVGKIVPRNLLRNQYRIELQSGATWTFHLPLFQIHFWGESCGVAGVWVVVGASKRQWNLLFAPGADNLHLVCSLAFIHRQWWCYS